MWIELALLAPAALRFETVRYCLAMGLVVSAALAEQLPTEVFSVREGLHTTIVDRIVADSKGFVWIPSAEGLARFDGNGFRIFTRADGLPAGAVLDIFERADGSYWVAVEDQLCLMDPRPGRRRFQCESPNLGTIPARTRGRAGFMVRDSVRALAPPDQHQAVGSSGAGESGASPSHPYGMAAAAGCPGRHLGHNRFAFIPVPAQWTCGPMDRG